MNRKEIRVGTILSYVYIFLNLIIQIGYTPIMLRLLGQSEYGLYTLVTNVVSYLSLFSLGFTGAYLRYYSREIIKSDKKEVYRLNGMFLSIFLIMATLAIITGGVLSFFPEWLFGNKLSVVELLRSQILFRILVINIAITFPMSVFDSIIISQERFIFQKLLTIAKSLFGPLVTIPLLIAGFGSVAMVLVTTIVTFFQLCVAIYYCVKKLGTRFLFDKLNLRKLKDIGGFSFFIFLNMIIDQLNWSIDNLVLGRVVGTLEVAIYGVASQIRSVFSMFSSPISSVYAPTVNRIIAVGADSMDDDLTKLMVGVGRIQFLILLYIYVGFVFCGRRFIVLWAGKEYVDSYITTLLLVTPLVFVLPCSMGIEIRRAKNMHRFPTLIMLSTAILNLLFSIPLAHIWGAQGTAMATGISLIINAVWMGNYYTKKMNIDVKQLYRNMFKIIIKMSIPILFGIFGIFVKKDGWLVLWTLFYTVCYALVLFQFVLNDNEKIAISKVIEKLKKGKGK